MRAISGILSALLIAATAAAAPAAQPPKQPASPQDKNVAQEGASLFNRGKDLAASGNLRAAIEAYNAIPPSDPRAPLAAVQIRELQGKLDRQGRGKDGAQAPGVGEAAGQAPGAGETAGMSPALLSRLQSAFGLKSQSATLRGVIERASHGRELSFADLEKEGIRFAVGAARQKDAVELSERDGKQVLTLHPSVFASGSNARVAAQMGRGLEEAATQRD